MATPAGTLELVARELAVALGVLEDRLGTGRATAFFAELGLLVPDGLSDAAELATALGAAATSAAELAPLVVDLNAAIEDENVARIAAAGAELLVQIGHTLTAVGAVADAVSSVTAALGGLTPQQRAEVEAFAAALPRRILDHVVVEYASRRAPAALGALDALGLVVRAPVPPPASSGAGGGGGGGGSMQPGYERRELHPERLPALLRDPAAYLRAVYGWGEPTFDGVALFETLARCVQRDLAMPAVLLRPAGQPALLEIYLFGLRVDPTANPPGLVVDARFSAGEGLTQSFPLKKPWRVQVEASAEFAADASAQITPPLHVELTPPAGSGGSAGIVDVDLSAGLIAEPATGTGPGGGTGTGTGRTGRMLLVGAADGTRVEAARVALTFGFAAAWDAAAGHAAATPQVSAEIDEGRVILAFGGGADGFLSAVLPDTMEIEVDLDATWNPEDGLTASGGAGLEVVVPLALDLGPARVDRLTLRLAVSDDGLTLDARAGAGITLGPFSASVDGVGAGVALAFHSGNGGDTGNLGPVDLGLRFLPPTGLGLAIAAGPVSGGGFIRYDEPAGRYAGLLELKLGGTIGVQAVGLLDTRLPGGAGGYALLVLLRASFPPIQLGFGLALTSVGGLLALNRRVDVDALRARMAAGTAGRFLAPEDPVRDAPVLFADLSAVFPPAPGVVIVGPTLRLTWAGLVRFDVGVFLELPGPSRVVLLGSARAAIENPSGGRPYLQIRVDILGVVDLAAHTLAFDAVLVDSHLLEIFELTGGAALRMSWGADPYLVFTLGGFHPAYSPAPLVLPPGLTRIAMVRGTPEDFLYLRLEGYLAITTNALQFGAAAELVISLGPFNIRGFLGFDALVQRRPLRFELQIAASVKVRYKKHNLGGLELRGALTGPGPVVFRGRVCFEILWFDICFEETFTLGSSTPPAVAPIASAVAELAGELSDPVNVRAQGGVDPRVTVEPAADTDLPVVSPLGQAVWSQQRAPLDLLLQRFEGAPLSRPETVVATGALVTGRDTDWFAPGSFVDLDDADALNRRAFERLNGGVRLASAGTANGPSAQLTVTVRQIRVPAPSTPSPPPPALPAPALPGWLQRGAAGRVGAVERDPVTPALRIRDETWDVHGRGGAGVVTAGVSQAQAHQLARVAAAGTAVAATDMIAAAAF